jgi:amidase
MTCPDGPRDAPDHGAFVPGPRLRMRGADHGPLARVRLAVKDLFDIEGHVTGCGNPDWAAAQAPAPRTAEAVARLLAAGADVVGKTVTDEISLGLLGRNRHHGTPLNPLDPGRLPGGSSSGSAVAVAAGHADLALGSDSGGSVRVPSAFLGLWGLRPTHGAISTGGLMVQSPSFDTVGVMARDPDLFAQAAEILLPDDSAAASGLAVLTDAFALADPPLWAPLEEAVARIERRAGPAKAVRLGDLPAWADAILEAQGAEFAATFAPWLDEADPRLSWDVAQALATARAMSPETIAAARAFRQAASRRLDALLGDRMLLLPTAPTLPPPRGSTMPTIRAAGRRLIDLVCIAGLTGRPQVSIPVTGVEGCGVGLSLLGPRGADRALLGFATCQADRSRSQVRR